jgi:hypothetical protein
MRTLSALLLGIGLLRADSLLVLSKGDLTLAIVDPTTLKVVAKMPSGPDPHEVVASTDGKYAYISNYGGGAYNTITVVDLVAHKTLNPPIDTGALRGPHGLAVVDEEYRPDYRDGAESDAHGVRLRRSEADHHFEREFGDDDDYRSKYGGWARAGWSSAGWRSRARPGWSPAGRWSRRSERRLG